MKAFAFSLLLLAALPAPAEELRGRIELLARGGERPARGADVLQAVVYFEPAADHGVSAPAKPFEIVTRNKEFLPRVLAVPRGSRVRFPNEDPILHNVFSVSGEGSFDLGLVPKGPGKERKFDRPGLVRVYCNVHHDMVAYVQVLDTPYFARPAADGSFVLSGLPPVPGRLTVWHEQAEPWTAEVTFPRRGPLAVEIEVVRPRVPPHLNKFGRSYFRSQRDRYRNRP